MAERAVLQDGTGVAIGTTTNPLVVNSNARVVTKLVTFTADANSPGDIDGTTHHYTLCTVTGVVAVKVFGVCGLTLVGAGKIDVGMTGFETQILAQIQNATTLATAEVFTTATCDSILEAMPTQFVVNGAAGTTMIQTAATADITDGNITYYIIWEPISSGATVV